MAKNKQFDSVGKEEGEEQLEVLIKQAGEEARTRRNKALDEHSKKLKKAIKKAISQRQEPIPT